MKIDEKQFEQIVAGLNIDDRPNTEHKQALRKKMLDACKESPSETTAIRIQPVWSKIMKSRAAQGAIVTMIIIGALIGIKLLDGTPVYGMSEVVEQLRNARTIHIYNSIHYEKNQAIERNEKYVLEDWIDIEGGRTRTSAFGIIRVHNRESGKPQMIQALIEHVFDGEYQMQVNQHFKSVHFNKLSNFQKLLHTKKAVESFLDKTYLSSKELSEYVKVGQEKIDNEQLDIWQRKKLFTNSIYKTICWVKPSTCEIRYVKAWKKKKDDDKGEWKLVSDVKIEFNVTPPPNTFSTEVPEGYRHANTKDTAYESPLRSRQLPLETIEGSIVTAFTLPDGSVIMGWYSEDKNNTSPDDSIFENLEAGGDIPKLPAEIYSIESFEDKETGTLSDTIYYGRHLAYTKKEGRFYEWSIYIPDKNIVQQEALPRYRVLAKLNPETRQDPNREYLDRTVSSLTIRPSEFNAFVLGAMKECSDNPEAIENITYDMVSELSNKIRNSIEK